VPARSEPLAALLWQLRAVHLDEGLEEEFRFHPLRRWRFDLAWPARLIACEVDGGAWIGGRHTSGAGFEADCEKVSIAAALGWRVLRVTPRQVERGQALIWLEAALALPPRPFATGG
jgi:very-short-patch-repair endonuclease